jgi:hypothetical protein
LMCTPYYIDIISHYPHIPTVSACLTVSGLNMWYTLYAYKMGLNALNHANCVVSGSVYW